MSIRCPVCGANIQPGAIPSVRNNWFACSRCRAQLTVAASDPRPVLAVSVALSAGFCLALGVRGYVLILAIVAATMIFYGLGQFLRSFVAAPKLQRSGSEDKVLHLAKRIHSSR
jgi:hypothetical protein